jgi:hypothetical protein
VRVFPVLCACASLWPAAARAGPDPAGAVRALVATPFRVAGDAVGAGSLLGASLLGTFGDAVSLADDPYGLALLSGPVKRLALGVSQGGTGFLEGLRAEDIERLPEPRAAYLGNAPFLGRLDTAWTGLGVIRLSLEDTLTGPALFALRLAGASGAADSVSAFVRNEQLAVLGPE